MLLAKVIEGCHGERSRIMVGGPSHASFHPATHDVLAKQVQTVQPKGLGGKLLRGPDERVESKTWTKSGATDTEVL